MANNVYDVIVVGASVSGSRTAELIAKEGYRVLLIEEHRKVGYPIKCTGLVSWRILGLLSDLPKEIIANKVSQAKFFSPSGKFFTLKSKNPVYVIRREKLDRYLFDRACESGADTKLSTKFEGFKYTNGYLEVRTDKGNFKTKLLVGADGANSLVAKYAKIKKLDNGSFIGIQGTVKGNFDSNSVELWFGSSIAPEFFAWVVPENKTIARIGLATRNSSKDCYEKFLLKRVGKIVKPNVGGIIRTGLIEESVANRVLLVGDSAFQIKPFSAGGIIYGLISSEYCAGACVNSLRNIRFDRNFLKREYDDKWKEVLAKPIKKGLFYRKVLDKLSDRQLNLLFASGKLLKLTNILESWDMDLLSD